MLIVLPFRISVLLGNEQDPRYIYKFSNHLRKARLNKNIFLFNFYLILNAFCLILIRTFAE